MPTSKYTYKETYYLIQDVSVLDMKVPEMVLVKIGFPMGDGGVVDFSAIPEWLKNKLGIVDYVTLGMILNNQIILPDDKVGHCIQLTPYAKLLESTTSVRDYIAEEDFELAKLQYGVSEFLTQSEYKELISNLTQNNDE